MVIVGTIRRWIKTWRSI